MTTPLTRAVAAFNDSKDEAEAHLSKLREKENGRGKEKGRNEGRDKRGEDGREFCVGSSSGRSTEREREKEKERDMSSRIGTGRMRMSEDGGKGDWSEDVFVEINNGVIKKRNTEEKEEGEDNDTGDDRSIYSVVEDDDNYENEIENNDKKYNNATFQKSVKSFLIEQDVITNSLNLLEEISTVSNSSLSSTTTKKSVTLNKKPDLAVFRLFCTVLVRAHENNLKKRELLLCEINGTEKEDKKNTETAGIEKSEQIEVEKKDIVSKDGQNFVSIKQKIVVNKNMADGSKKDDNLVGGILSEKDGQMDGNTEKYTPFEMAKRIELLQNKLQHSLDELNIENVGMAVSEGAIVEAKHIRQAALYFGDEHVSLFSYLLSYGEIYMADRYDLLIFVCILYDVHFYYQYV